MIYKKLFVFDYDGESWEDVYYIGSNLEYEFVADIKFSNCGEVVNDNIHLDVNKLKEYTEKIYKNYNDIKEFNFDKCRFFISIDNMSQICYSLKLHKEQMLEHVDIVLTYKEYIIKRLLE